MMVWVVKMYVRAVYVFRALRDINKLKLGDLVYYQGKPATAIQGVGNPYWDIHDPERGRLTVHKSELKLQPFTKRAVFSFRSTYQFFMGYWFDIDVRNRAKFIFKG